MEILIGLTILAVIVRVIIFFCAPELDETLSGFNSTKKDSFKDRPRYKHYDDGDFNEGLNPLDSGYNLGAFAKHDPSYSSYIGKHDN